MQYAKYLQIIAQICDLRTTTVFQETEFVYLYILVYGTRLCDLLDGGALLVRHEANDREDDESWEQTCPTVYAGNDERISVIRKN